MTTDAFACWPVWTHDRDGIDTSQGGRVLRQHDAHAAALVIPRIVRIPVTTAQEDTVFHRSNRYEVDPHVRAIAGDCPIGEPLTVRQRQDARDAALKALVWIGALAGSALVWWAVGIIVKGWFS